MARSSRLRSSRPWRAAADVWSRSNAIQATSSRCRSAIARVAQAAAQADAIFIPDATDSAVVQGLTANGVNPRRVQFLGTGLWTDDPQIASNPMLQGAWFAAPEPAGYRNFVNALSQPLRTRPLRTATLAYDAVSLVAALVKTQGAQRFTEQVLTNPSGFSGIDGIFRFRADGTNERGLAVLRVAPGGRPGDQPGAEDVPRLGDVKRDSELAQRTVTNSAPAATPVTKTRPMTRT